MIRPTRVAALPRSAVVAAFGLLAVRCNVADRRAPADLIVTGGIVLTLDADNHEIPDGAVAVAGGSIVGVGPSSDIAGRFRSDRILDARGRAVMPGLVNTHTHAPMVLFRGVADDLPLAEWLQNNIFPAEAKNVTPEFVRWGTRLAALEMIQGGTTLFVDMYYFEDVVARETRAAGIRGVLGETIIGLPSPDARTPADALTTAERFIQAFRGDSRIIPAVAPHALYTNTPETIVASKRLADRYDVPMLIHLAETLDENRISRDRYGQTPAAYLETLGVLGPNVLAAHGVWLSPADIEVLKAHDVAVSHNPESNMKLASGVAPMAKLAAAGVRLGLGTDGAASNNDLDMFEAMRFASLLEKVSTMNPATLTARDVLRLATIDGARALGLGKRLGSLEAGKGADLITVALDAPRQTPLYDVASHLVYATKCDDVRDVIVDGQIVMRDRHVLTLNEPEILAKARALSEGVRRSIRK